VLKLTALIVILPAGPVDPTENEPGPKYSTPSELSAREPPTPLATVPVGFTERFAKLVIDRFEVALMDIEPPLPVAPAFA
jgi:hypothetical protein